MKNPLGLASLIVGLISVGLIFVFGVGIFVGPVAIILGIIGCIKDESKVLSILGIILGIIGFAVSLFWLIFIISSILEIFTFQWVF